MKNHALKTKGKNAQAEGGTFRRGQRSSLSESFLLSFSPSAKIHIKRKSGEKRRRKREINKGWIKNLRGNCFSSKSSFNTIN